MMSNLWDIEIVSYRMSVKVFLSPNTEMREKKYLYWLVDSIFVYFFLCWPYINVKRCWWFIVIDTNRKFWILLYVYVVCRDMKPHFRHTYRRHRTLLIHLLIYKTKNMIDISVDTIISSSSHKTNLCRLYKLQNQSISCSKKMFTIDGYRPEAKNNINIS